MLQPMNRRRFLQVLGARALILSRAVPTRATAQGDRLSTLLSVPLENNYEYVTSV
jgi:hypothetical protein